MKYFLQLNRVPNLVLVLLAAAAPQAVYGDSVQPGAREDSIASCIQAFEEAAQRSQDEGVLEEFIERFERDHCASSFITATSSEERRALLAQILDITRTATASEVTISPLWVRIELYLPNEVYEVTFTTQDESPFAITSLAVENVTNSRPSYTLTADNLSETFKELEKDGFSGVVHVRKNGKVLLQEAYGMANVEFGYPVKCDTVFGIGSTPMDFTLMSIFLLEQRGRIDRDDALSKYFENVPEDKQNITIRQLISGESGLPDFFETEDDWDPDLAYIDRKTAEDRLFSQTLLFEPGSDSSHSHGAYGLLASIIERVSGKDYYSFLKENFFDPAGMTRTAMNGGSMGLNLSEFAVGQGPVFFGLPNIPPNWGKTSWLVMGSGGMCSTMEDMLKFFALVRSDSVLKPPYNERFNLSGSSLNGSMRGAYLSHAYEGAGNEAILMSNIDADSPREGDLDEKIRALVRALEVFVSE
ncbi:MAG: serine hydrolase [Candidatus Hydrogenedentes bacterium]|nr:serine hydrolase [Candidatus Hydrogenedentota bacterium]